MHALSDALLRDMEAKGIDARMSLAILDDYNAGLYDGVEAVRAVGVPAVDGRSVIAIGPSMAPIAFPARDARNRLGELGMDAAGRGLPEGVEERSAASGEPVLVFPRAALETIGAGLLARCAYGVLNGGSATSYADSKKNLAFGQGVFDALAPAFDSLAPLCRDRPKGLAPAFVNPDGSPGPSFLLLKMRARLLAATRLAADAPSFMPLFQMTSVANDAELAAAYRDYRDHPLLAGLAIRAGLEPSAWATGIQPMISAYTHSSEGRPKRVFDRAQGRPDSALPLPGGHGQCFRVLASTLRALRDTGARFAYLGNVDNVGCLPDPVEIALLALSGLPAGFDFALRTPVDVKGGILVETSRDAHSGVSRRTVADIGPAITFDEVRRLESEGASILFNCATGLFDLDWLVPRIEDLGRRLPVRFTDQDKDAGRYSQAEQVTWEVTSLLPGFLAFAVSKYDRFIAAKLLTETLLTSGIGAGDPRIPPDLAGTSRLLREGLQRRLIDSYGLVLRGGRWLAPEAE